MKKLFKKLALMVVVLLTFSVGSNYTVKEVKAAETEVVFNLGANGTATHYDGTSKTTYTETVDGYTLNITGGTNMYTGARDAKGNSCIKMGTSSKAGSFTISSIPEDVTSVTIDVAAYKAKTAKVKVNDEITTLTTKSDNGVYDAITVDTSSNKTISFAVSSGYRCMVNTITYGIVDNGGSDESKPSIDISVDKNYTQIGENLTFTANLENTTGSIEWSSSDDAIATVNDGVVIPVSMGEVTITATVDGVSDNKVIKVYPKDNSELSIAEALKVCALTGEDNAPYTYSTTGTIKSIDTPYDSGYGNISVTITDGTDSIKAFRMKGGEELNKGDEITVTGTLVNYGGNTPEFIAGCTYVKEEVTFDKIQTMAQLDFSYDYIEGDLSIVTAAYSGGTTGNMIEGENNASALGLDEEKWEVIANKGKASNLPGLNKDGDFRLYYNVDGSNTITFTSKNDTITSIFITFTGESYSNASVNVDGNPVSGENGLYDINSSSFVIGNANASNAQVRIKSIEIKVGTPNTYHSFRNINLRYSITTPTSLFENVESFGFNISVGSSDKDYSVTKTTVEGDNTSFSLVLTNVTDFKTDITVAGYVIVDGERIDLGSKTYSVESMIQYYLDNSSDLGLSSTQVEVLNAFKDEIA